jgi:hypothetical protein
LWIVEQNGEFYVWRVELDAPEHDDGSIGEPYLRFSDTDTSEPIEGHQWPPARSYGPCPMPNGDIMLRSAIIANPRPEE